MITQDQIINDVLLGHPETVEVFSKYGIDSCCGGAKTIQAAASAHRIPLDMLLSELRDKAGRKA
ncbi:MAG: DUF542 domain-containing protein [Armatimonadetes bacterium]|nr:DUF542 domain-containing protein [Armatimonadota bacterium]